MKQFSNLRIASLFLGLAVIACSCGVAPDGTIGGRVWLDVNGNGLRDPGELGVPGFGVSLYKAGGDLVDSTETDELGAYEFEGLAYGRYFLAFLALQGNLFTLHNAGDIASGSDVDPLTGRTEVFELGQTVVTRDAGLLPNEPTLPPLPSATPTPTPTPVVPPTGGTYRFRVTFVRVSGNCGGPAQFMDMIDSEIGAAGQTSTFRQPSTGDVNTGMIQPDGTFDVSSARESYVGTLEFVRDENGNVVRVILRGLNTYTDTQGCVTTYEVESEVQIPTETPTPTPTRTETPTPTAT